MRSHSSEKVRPPPTTAEIPPIISAPTDPSTEAASKKGSKTIRKGKDKLASVSPRPADRVFEVHSSHSTSALPEKRKSLNANGPTSSVVSPRLMIAPTPVSDVGKVL